MDVPFLVPVLGLMTLFAVVVFALLSKKGVEERRRDPTAPTSTLAKDGPQGGVDTLLPPDQRHATKPDAAPVLN